MIDDLGKISETRFRLVNLPNLGFETLETLEIHA